MGRRDALEQWLRFARSESHILLDRPQLLFQQAANQPDPTEPARAAMAWIAEGGERRPWLRQVNRRRNRSACLMTFSTREEHGSTVALSDFSPDGRRILLGLADESPLLVHAGTGREIALLVGHREQVTGARFSSDGRRVCTSSNDITLRLWDGETGEAVAVLEGHRDFIQAFAFSPDDSRIASVSTYLDPVVKVWDATTGDEIATLPHGPEAGEQLFCCAFSPDGRRIVSSGDDTIRLWDARTFRELAASPQPNEETNANVAMFAAGGASLVCHNVYPPHWLALWNVHRLELAGRLPTLLVPVLGRRVASRLAGWLARVLRARRAFSVRSGAYMPRGKALSPGGDSVAVLSGPTVRLLDARTGRGRVTLEGHARDVVAWAWSPDGDRLVTASESGSLRLWDSTSGRELARLGEHPAAEACAFLPPGDRIASVAESDRTIRIWDVETGERRAWLAEHTGPVYASFSASPDGTRLVSQSFDEVKLWDLTLSEPLARFSGHATAIRGCAFSPDGSRAATAASDNTVKLWDTVSGEDLTDARLFPEIRERGGCSHVAFAPSLDGLAAAISYDERPGTRPPIYSVRLELLGSTGDHRVTLLEEEGAPVCWTRFSPDGSLLLSCHGARVAGDTGEARRFVLALWDGRTGAPLHGIGQMWRGGWRGPVTAFSPRGRRLAVADASEITIWSTRRGVRLSDTVEHGLPVNDLVFSPDGNTLFSASDDETLQAWDLPAGARGAMLRGHEGPVERCRLSPDGRWLASEGADRRVKVWDLESGRERSTLAARGLHGFTADGRLLVCAHGWVVQLWDRERALAVAEYVTGNRVTAVGTDRSGRRIAVGCEGGGVHLLELHADTRRPRFPNTPTGSRNG